MAASRADCEPLKPLTDRQVQEESPDNDDDISVLYDARSPSVGDACYACFFKRGSLTDWYAATVRGFKKNDAEVSDTSVPVKHISQVLVEFADTHRAPNANGTAWVAPQYVALAAPICSKLRPGARVVALQIDDCRPTLINSWRAGVVGEGLEAFALTEQRYLVFFDDGYVQYSNIATTKLVLKSDPTKLREEILNESAPHRNFVMNYLAQCMEHQKACFKCLTVDARDKTKRLLCLRANDDAFASSNDEWWAVKVLLVSASMAKVMFLPDGNREVHPWLPQEWLYRGSPRLSKTRPGVPAIDERNGNTSPIRSYSSADTIPIGEGETEQEKVQEAGGGGC